MVLWVLQPFFILWSVKLFDSVSDVLCVRVCMRLCACVHVCAHVCMRLCACAQVYIRTSVHALVCVRAGARAHVRAGT